MELIKFKVNKETRKLYLFNANDMLEKFGRDREIKMIKRRIRNYLNDKIDYENSNKRKYICNYSFIGSSDFTLKALNDNEFIFEKIENIIKGVI